MKKNLLVILGLAAFAGVVALVLSRQIPPKKATQIANTPAQQSTLTVDSTGTDSDKKIVKTDNNVGATSTKDDKTQDGVTSAGSAKPKASDDPFDYGKTPPVKGDANENVKSVVEAVRGKTNPERLSVMIAPKPFDAEAFKNDPKKYLNTVEPGRAFQPLQPGEGVPVLKPVSPAFVRIAQNGSTPLRVQTMPGGVATFTSFDLGRFNNQLTSITVQADAQGIAEATFFGALGTIEDVHIVCASPMTSGTVRFTVNISKPQ